MCGRLTLYTPPDHLARIFGADLEAGLDPEGRPSWNVPPTRSILAVTAERTAEGADDDGGAGGVGDDGGAGGGGDDHVVRLHRTMGRFRWGLVPSWADDPAIGGRMFNARAETVATKPSFRSAYVRRRAAVVADGFYEWHTGPDRTKQPYYFTRADGAPLALAGLWEVWSPAGGDAEQAPLRSCTVITTEAGPDLAAVHHRTPVVLEADSLDEWLDPGNTDKGELAALLAAPAAGTLVGRRVDRAVGNVRNDGASLIETVPDDDGGGPPVG